MIEVYGVEKTMGKYEKAYYVKSYRLFGYMWYYSGIYHAFRNIGEFYWRDVVTGDKVSDGVRDAIESYVQLQEYKQMEEA